MTNTPLNPDGVHAATEAVFATVRFFDKTRAKGVSELAIASYLTVAHPLVNTFEELDSMPDGSVVKDSVGEVYIMTPYDEFWRVWGNYKRFSSCEIVLPARVLYLPEVKS